MAEDGIEFIVEGLPEFNTAMTELAGPAAERILRAGARAGGRVFQLAVTEAAPVAAVGEAIDFRTGKPVTRQGGTSLPPGALKNDIIVRVTKEDDGSISSYTGPGRLTRHVARWVEDGHELIVNGKNVGRVEAHPFVRPAFEEAEIAAQDAAGSAMITAFIREAARQQVRED
jgi:hypothetical protein